MITLSMLLANMYYYMFTGNTFLHCGSDGSLILGYFIVGIVGTALEILVFSWLITKPRD